jgi:hypothetical protein
VELQINQSFEFHSYSTEDRTVPAFVVLALVEGRTVLAFVVLVVLALVEVRTVLAFVVLVVLDLVEDRTVLALVAVLVALALVIGLEVHKTLEVRTVLVVLAVFAVRFPVYLEDHTLGSHLVFVSFDCCYPEVHSFDPAADSQSFLPAEVRTEGLVICFSCHLYQLVLFKFQKFLTICKLSHQSWKVLTSSQFYSNEVLLQIVGRN